MTLVSVESRDTGDDGKIHIPYSCKGAKPYSIDHPKLICEPNVDDASPIPECTSDKNYLPCKVHFIEPFHPIDTGSDKNTVRAEKSDEYRAKPISNEADVVPT